MILKIEGRGRRRRPASIHPDMEGPAALEDFQFNGFIFDLLLLLREQHFGAKKSGLAPLKADES